jgi:transcriptional regulator with XRE-family HTH domain
MINGVQSRAARAILNMSTAEIARGSNLSTATIARFENGADVKPSSIEKLEAFFNAKKIGFGQSVLYRSVYFLDVIDINANEEKL